MLTVTDFDRGAERGRSRRDQPVPGAGYQGVAREQRMIVSLNHHQAVARGVLCCHVPRLFPVTGASADVQPRALPECVEGESLVLAEGLAVLGLDWPR